MFSITLMGFGIVLGSTYFGIGRMLCPAHDRLPLRDLDGDAVVATIRRGWNAAGRS